MGDSCLRLVALPPRRSLSVGAPPHPVPPILHSLSTLRVRASSENDSGPPARWQATPTPPAPATAPPSPASMSTQRPARQVPSVCGRGYVVEASALCSGELELQGYSDTVRTSLMIRLSCIQACSTRTQRPSQPFPCNSRVRNGLLIGRIRRSNLILTRATKRGGGSTLSENCLIGGWLRN